MLTFAEMLWEIDCSLHDARVGPHSVFIIKGRIAAKINKKEKEENRSGGGTKKGERQKKKARSERENRKSEKR